MEGVEEKKKEAAAVLETPKKKQRHFIELKVKHLGKMFAQKFSPKGKEEAHL